MAWLDPSLQDNADSAKRLADQFRGHQLRRTGHSASKFDQLSRDANDASQSTKRLKDKLDSVGVSVDKLNRKKVNNLLRDNAVPGVNRQGGTTVRFAGGPVMPGSSYLVGEIGPGVVRPAGRRAAHGRHGRAGGSATSTPRARSSRRRWSARTANVPQAPAMAAAAPSGRVHIENLTCRTVSTPAASSGVDGT